MNIGLIGSGGREHALCKKLYESEICEKIFCFPGNAGTANLAYNLNVNILDFNEILKLTNLAENFNTSELIDNCLSKNHKKTVNILNENNYSSDDVILIIKTLLNKSKRLLELKRKSELNKNLEECISTHKPPIFWKDKEIVKQQINNWSLKNIESLIYEINEIELLAKRYSLISLNIISDFLINQSNKLSN